MLFTILSTPPPTSFLYFTSAMSGSMPVVSQSIMKPMVPVGASTVTWALRTPDSSASRSASPHAERAAETSSAGARLRSIRSTSAACLRRTPRHGSRFFSKPAKGPV